VSPSPDFDLSADAYRRRIRVRAVEPDVVVSELEDDFHHFVVTLRHDGEKVLSCDNAVPHLLRDEDLTRAAAGMYAKLRPGGLLVVSMRDYDQIIAEKPRAELPRVFDRPDGRQIAFQVWDWDPDAPTYTLH